MNSIITTGYALARAAYAVATEYKTIYVRSCFGAPMTEPIKQFYINGNAFNQKPERMAAILAAPNDAFGFECSGLIKGLLWGWCGDLSARYGGAKYKNHDIPDLCANDLIKACPDASTDFSKIEIGEAVWKDGHIGIYVGGGLSVECTYRWDDGVQITACNTSREGHHSRVWTKHGRLPWLTYTGATEDVSTAVFHGFDPAPEPQEPYTFSLTLPRQKGPLVTSLQSLLNYAGYTDDEGKPVEIDGTLGPRTWQGLMRFVRTYSAAPETSLIRVYKDDQLIREIRALKE